VLEELFKHWAGGVAHCPPWVVGLFFGVGESLILYARRRGASTWYAPRVFGHAVFAAMPLPLGAAVHEFYNAFAARRSYSPASALHAAKRLPAYIVAPVTPGFKRDLAPKMYAAISVAYYEVIEFGVNLNWPRFTAHEIHLLTINQAFTARSEVEVSTRVSHQALAQIGDAVIGAILIEDLARTGYTSGDICQIKSRAVSAESISAYVRSVLGRAPYFPVTFARIIGREPRIGPPANRDLSEWFECAIGVLACRTTNRRPLLVPFVEWAIRQFAVNCTPRVQVLPLASAIGLFPPPSTHHDTPGHVPTVGDYLDAATVQGVIRIDALPGLRTLYALPLPPALADAMSPPAPQVYSLAFLEALTANAFEQTGPTLLSPPPREVLAPHRPHE
jgi:hypothetical protein